MTIKTLLVIFYNTLMTIQATKNQEKFCDPISNDLTKQCYRKETMVILPHSPNQIAVDTANYLYFSFDSGQGEYVPAKLKIGNHTITVLKGINDAFAIANDPETGNMFFGGSHGIYKYNPDLKQLKRLAVANLDIWWLVLNKDIYFIKFPSLIAYRYSNRTINYVHELKDYSVHQFTFDKEGNIYFINSTGFYGIKQGENNAILIRDYPRFLGMASDKDGYIYLCSEDGIFILSKVIEKVKRIINVQGVLGMTFDKDNNLIYSDSQEIVRLISLSKAGDPTGVTKQ